MEEIVKTINGQQVTFIRIPKDRVQRHINYAAKRALLREIHAEIAPAKAKLNWSIE